MTSERAWLLRLLAALGTVGPVTQIAGCVIGQSSCPESQEPNWQDRCFTKAELAADAGPDAAGAAGGGAASSCPTIEEIQRTRLYGYAIESVTDNGESCCYRGSYPCEGRPLFSADAPVVASTVPRADWRFDDVNDDAEIQLEPGIRATLALAWARDAAFEHASIASFGHFILELLALGAPAELVREAERALSDELQHAEMCYALASRYAGRHLGPGTLAVPAFAPRPLREAALAALREGCIAETQAAYAARQRLALATDPLVQRVLERIVPDEERHAVLAFRFLRWALDRDETLLADVERAFKGALAAPRGDLSSSDSSDAAILRAHGQLLPPERWRISLAAIDRIIKPCWQALSMA